MPNPSGTPRPSGTALLWLIHFAATYPTAVLARSMSTATIDVTLRLAVSPGCLGDE